MKKLLLLSLIGICSAATNLYAQEEKVAEAIAESVEVVGTPVEKIKPDVRPLTISVEVTGGHRISGTLLNSDQLTMKTSFGEASIPLSEVAGVRLASGEDVSTTVVMLNGDSITGAVDLKQISIETDWGTASVKGSAILSMLFVPNVQWQASSNLSGRRWTLVDSKPTAVPTAPGSGLPNPALGNTRSVNPQPSQPVAPAIRNGFIIGQ